MAVLFEPKQAVNAISWNWPEVAEAQVLALALHSFDPLTDARWEALVERHPRASVFHSSAWLTALQRTYGYTPIAYTTGSSAESLQDAIVFCRVESWLTGHRLVSLPFSDHCEPLMENGQVPSALASILNGELPRSKWRYLELRPIGDLAIKTSYAHTPIEYAFHQLGLASDLPTLFGNFHKSSIQRKIRRAEREGLTYREGASEELLDIFYRLFALTRSRHRVPPPPRDWFVNLIKCFGPALKIRVASKAGRPVASMITLRHKETMVYKYGCSDVRFNNLGGMHLLYWNAIQEAKVAGLSWFDFGRTDADQQSLITFKNRWGATQSVLTYSRYGASTSSTHFFDISTEKWKSRAAKKIVSYLPDRVISKVGQLLYSHVG